MTELTLAELARQTGVPARTIRFYIARGLLPPPARAGRGACYGPEHREGLARIKRLQARGLTLAEIARRLGGETRRDGLPVPSAWWCYPIERDVVLWVRADAAPWRLKQVRRAVLDLAAQLKTIQQEEDNDVDASD
jgi:DNA-binding transcriptional MerR regulator